MGSTSKDRNRTGSDRATSLDKRMRDHVTTQREDCRWFRGHAVACEDLGLALRLSLISAAKANRLRERLTGECDGYCNMGALYRARYRADQKWGWR